MGEKGLAKLVLILSVVLFIGAVMILIWMNTVGKKTFPSKANTTEFFAVIQRVYITETDDREQAVIYTEKYGRLQIPDLNMVNNMKDFNSLQPGQPVLFRIENARLKTFQKSDFSFTNIVSLKTANKEIVSLSSRSNIMNHNRNKFIIACAFFIIIFVLAVKCQIIMHKRYPAAYFRKKIQSDIDIKKVYFENRFIHSEDFYQEFYWNLCLGSPTKLLITVSVALIILLFIFMDVMDVISGYRKAAIHLDALILLLLWLGFWLYLYFVGKKSTLNRNALENGGKPVESKLTVTENNINLCTDNRNLNIDLTHIKKAVPTRNYYILISKAGSSFSLKKDSFISGTASQFEDFLQSRKLFQ